MSAFGCGAFKNPPSHVAQLFREVLSEDEFKHSYKCISTIIHRFLILVLFDCPKIYFAILDDCNAGKKGNLQFFSDVFNNKCNNINK